jgi:hypothetical protein
VHLPCSRLAGKDSAGGSILGGHQLDRLARHLECLIAAALQVVGLGTLTSRVTRSGSAPRMSSVRVARGGGVHGW